MILALLAELIASNNGANIVSEYGFSTISSGRRTISRANSGTTRCDLTYLGENPESASGHMSGAVVDLVCSDQLS